MQAVLQGGGSHVVPNTRPPEIIFVQLIAGCSIVRTARTFTSVLIGTG